MKIQNVNEFIENLQHNQKKDILFVRNIILSIYEDSKLNLNYGYNNDYIIIEENIKWNSLNYTLNGEDRVTFNFAGKGFFRLILHCGAKVKSKDIQEEFNLIIASKKLNKLESDSFDLLTWLSKDRAMIKFDKNFDFIAQEPALKHIILLWLEKTKI